MVKLYRAVSTRQEIAMRRNALRLTIALGLIGLGWSVGHAQNADAPDFIFSVSAPAGETKVECVRGCNLLWSVFTPTRTAAVNGFTFPCSPKPATASSAPTTVCRTEFNGYLIRSN